MKFINLIFSIYIVALSCLPCADAESDFENKTVSIHNEKKAPSDKHHDDACSPFCICSCCHCNGFYKTVDCAENTVAIKTVTRRNKIEYTSTLFSNFHNYIWQPPQIS